MTPFVLPPPFAKTIADEVFSAPPTLEPPQLMAGRNFLIPRKTPPRGLTSDVKAGRFCAELMLLTGWPQAE